MALRRRSDGAASAIDRPERELRDRQDFGDEFASAKTRTRPLADGRGRPVRSVLA
jgi:hypothetical protein